MEKYKYDFKFDQEFPYIENKYVLDKFKYLNEFEKKYNIKLPEDYIDFLKNIGEGYLEDDNQYIYLEYKNKNISISLWELKSIVTLEIYGTFKIKIDGKEKKVIWIADAEDEPYGYSFIQRAFLCLDEDDYGTIYYQKLFPNARHKYIKIADSFDDLMQKFGNIPENVEDQTEEFTTEDFEGEEEEERFLV